MAYEYRCECGYENCGLIIESSVYDVALNKRKELEIDVPKKDKFILNSECSYQARDEWEEVERGAGFVIVKRI